MKRKLLTAILALFLPLVSAGQQSLTAYLLTSGPNADPADAEVQADHRYVGFQRLRDFFFPSSYE